MEVLQALQKIQEAGYHVEQIEADKFMVFDNGMFGFATEEDPFIVDGEGILEIFKIYVAS